MQFREQGKKIQCIRSTYDPTSKRSHQKVVGAFDRWADKLPSAVLAELTDAERAHLAELIATLHPRPPTRPAMRLRPSRRIPS